MVYLIPTPKTGRNSSGSNSAGGLFSLWNVIIFILFVIFVYFATLLLFYFINFCYKKKEISKYLFDFTFDPCDVKFAPTDAKNPFLERKEEQEKEVYHIANQDYTYEEADCKCKAYGGRLATREEIVDAYNHGADWCSYGWSQDQAAYYPTQKCTWDRLQQQGKDGICGSVGVNGGAFPPSVQFGINCYGIKPKGVVIKEKPPVCTDKEFCKWEADYQSTHKLRTDRVSPFNKDAWSIFKN